MAKLHFDPESHSYTLNGKPVPSVTQIINAVVPKPFERAMWYGWRLAKQGLDPEDKRTEAANLGTQVHLAFASLAAGEKVDDFDYPDEAAGFIKACRRFIDDHGPEFLASEHKTYSETHSYAGTLDAYVKFTRREYTGRIARLDLKTGRVYPESHFPQLEAYEGAEVERGQDPSDLRAVLKVTPKGSYKIIESTDDFEDFLVLKRHYDSVINRAQRMKK
jgi:hypothetical protein